jgi:acid phosphatase family membrane protein YuiD
MQLPIVLSAVFMALVLSQGLKILLLLFVHKQKFYLADLFVTGGMPSSHSAIVTALVVAVGLTEGISNLFVLCAVLAAIVIRDALGVRRTAGEEGKLLNRIISMTKLKVKPLHYSLGHTPAEVTIGVLIGIVSGCVVLLL